MIMLSIDTSSPKFSISIFEYEQEIALYQALEQQTQARDLVMAINQLFLAHKYNIQCLKKIVVNIGPGSFTGIRIGLAAAQGIALGVGAALYGISAFDALSQDNPDSVITVFAGRGNYYCKQGDAQAQTLSSAEALTRYAEVQIIGELATTPQNANSTVVARSFLKCSNEAQKLMENPKPIYIYLS